MKKLTYLFLALIIVACGALKEEIIELKLHSVKDKKGGLEDSENSIEGVKELKALCC